MLFLDQVFETAINKTMTFKTLNLHEDEIDRYINVKLKCFRKIQLMEVCNVLNTCKSILSQFYFIYYPLDIKANRIAMYLFKKK